jgi:CRP/FNR family transcriptional activator FtrB
MRPGDHDLVRRFPVLSGLTHAALDHFLQGAFVQVLPRGAMLCVQDERPEFLHAILSGRVALLGQGVGRGETVVEFFGAGDMVILPAVLLDSPYLMSARVVEEARVLFIPAERARRAIKAEAALAHAAALHLAGHWRRIIRQVKDLKLRPATERLAAYLVSLAGKGNAGGIQLPEDRKLVAARLGMTAESLSRAFSALRAVGVGGRGRSVTVADWDKLRAFCEYDGTV